jgi:hypothetical protein
MTTTTDVEVTDAWSILAQNTAWFTAHLKTNGPVTIHVGTVEPTALHGIVLSQDEVGEVGQDRLEAGDIIYGIAKPGQTETVCMVHSDSAPV